MTKMIVFFCDTTCFEQINYIRTAVPEHAQLSLKCRLPNRINFDLYWPVLLQSWNEDMWKGAQLR